MKKIKQYRKKKIWTTTLTGALLTLPSVLAVSPYGLITSDEISSLVVGGFIALIFLWLASMVLGKMKK